MHRPALDPPSVPPPAGRRLPAGASAFPIGPEGLHLRFAAGGPATRLRLACALDLRDQRSIAVETADGRRLGRLRIDYACPCQIFELALTPEGAAAIAADGCTLRLEDGAEPCWAIGRMAGRGGELLAPHLLAGEAPDRWAAMRGVLASVAGLHPFGWLWGCVAAGLEDLHRVSGEARYREALRRQAERFWVDGAIQYENPRGEPHRGFHSIEATLPVAIMERVLGPGPGGAAIAAWAGWRRPDGLVADHGIASTEGCYTVAWPMAELGVARGDRALIESALLQLRERFARLVIGGRIHQRARLDGGEACLPDWARGAAWLLLGAVRTLLALPPAARPDDLLAALRRECARVAALQEPEGLWANFLGEAHPADSSGSAGIAAAFALGARGGLLEAGFLAPARRARAALGAQLTPDGLLGGCAQLNRGGEALQRSDYRVLSQMGMGLAAQLDAALAAC